MHTKLTVAHGQLGDRFVMRCFNGHVDPAYAARRLRAEKGASGPVKVEWVDTVTADARSHERLVTAWTIDAAGQVVSQQSR